MIEMVAPSPMPAPDCDTCGGTRMVEQWARHDGRDYPDKRGHYEVREVPCPDCAPGA